MSKYPDTEYMQDGDIVVNSTGTGTLGRVGIYRDSDNNYGKTIVPDSHVTIVRPHDFINAEYLYAFMKAMQPRLEQQGEGSTNQKELKPATLKSLIVPLPSTEEQYEIVRSITAVFNILNSITDWIN